MSVVRRIQIGENHKSAEVLNRPSDDIQTLSGLTLGETFPGFARKDKHEQLLTGSGYAADQTDFAGFVKPTDISSTVSLSSDRIGRDAGVAYAGEVGVTDVRYPVGDVRRYGLTGVGDETTALGNAITSAAAIGGVAVVIPANTTITARLTNVPSYTLIRGAGKDSSVLKLPSGANTHVVTVASGATLVRFKDLTIDGNAANQSAGSWFGVYSSGVTDRLRFERVRITNTKSHGMRSEGTVSGASTTNLRMRDCDIENVGGYGVIMNEKHTGARFIDSTFTNWGNVTAASDALAAWATNAGSHRRLKIVNCDFVGSSSNLFAFESVTPRIDGLTIAGCTFDGNDCGLSFCAKGATITGNVYLGGDGTSRSGMELSVSDATITGNTIANGTLVIAASSGFGVSPSNITITGNTIKCPAVTGKGIILGGDLPISTVIISGNTIDLTGATVGSTGMILGQLGAFRAVLSNIVVTNNILLTNSVSNNGITLAGAAGSTGLLIHKNFATGFGFGVAVGGSPAGHTEVTITENDLRGCVTPVQNNDASGGFFRVERNLHANGLFARQGTTANDAGWVDGNISELITLSTSGTTTDSVANLLPAFSLIMGVVARVTTTITTATDWKLGDSAQSARFCSAQTNLTAGSIVVGGNQFDPTNAASTQGPVQGLASAKLRITTTGTPGAGAIRVTVFYRQFRIPQS